MKIYRHVCKQSLLFLVLYVLCFLSAIAVTFSDTKVNSFVRLNSIHRHWLDASFTIITYLGDGLISILLSLTIMLVWRKYRLGIQILLAYIVSGIIAQLLKHAFAAPRPKAIISELNYHFFINGVTHGGFNSFPSGHTTSVFAVVTIVILSLRNYLSAVFLLMIAVIVGYSRIYLGQHFLEDVIAGSLLGVSTGILVYYLTLNVRWPFRRFILKKKSKGEANYSP